MQDAVYEIVDYVSNQPTKVGKIEALRRVARNPAFMTLLKMSLDQNLEWLVPEHMGYRPAPDIDQQPIMYSEVPKLTRFLNKPDINHYARRITPKLLQTLEKRFAGVLETVHPRDAEVLMNVRQKKSIGKGITRALVEEALPGLLQ